MSIPARLLRLLVLGYRYLVSPVLPASCRYLPTCSAYALDALHEHGALRGAWLAACRIGRCHPWGGGGVDPVPEQAPTLSSPSGGPLRPVDSPFNRHG
jgi:putative membrane protein insertion efficiency factor